MLLGFPPSRPEQSGNISLPLAILLLGQKSGVPPQKMPPPQKNRRSWPFILSKSLPEPTTLGKPPRTSGTGGIGSHFSLNTPWGKGIPQRFRQGFWLVAPQGFILISYTISFRKKVICLSCSNQDKTIY